MVIIYILFKSNGHAIHKDGYKRAKYAKFTLANFTASAVHVREI